MRILLSAIACNPDLGSEAKVGWDAVCAISAMPEVEECHVLTHVSAKEAISKAQSAGEASKVQFHFLGTPIQYHLNRLIARFQSWLQYRSWQKSILNTAIQLHKKHNFTLVHHITYVTWRVPPLLWKLPAPFVFGPVGGGSKLPHAFRPLIGPVARTYETLRDITTYFFTLGKAVRECCVHTKVCIAADTATADFLKAHGAKNVDILNPIFFSPKQFQRFSHLPKPDTTNPTPLQIFAGGSLEGRKGTRLSLHALAQLKKAGIPFQYTFGGNGPDLNAMTQLAKDLGISENVLFHEGFSGEDYTAQLAKSDVYLLPSIRETAGTTMCEAIIAKCYPILFAGTGAADNAELAGATPIEAATPEAAIEQIALRLTWCHHNREEMQKQAFAIGEKMAALYSTETYVDTIRRIYNTALGQSAA